MRTVKTNRVLLLTDLFLKGKTSLEDAKAAYREKGWRVSERTLYSDRASALEGFKLQLNEQRKELFAGNIARLEKLYADAYEDGNIRRCLDVLKEINRLFKFY